MSVMTDFYPSGEDWWAYRATPLELALDAYESECRERETLEKLTRPPVTVQAGTIAAARWALVSREDETCDAWQRVFDER